MDPPDQSDVVRSRSTWSSIPAAGRFGMDGSKVVDLTFTEFGVLSFLVRRPGWVFTRSQIVDAVRGSDYFVTDRSVDVQIVGLRKKAGTHGQVY